jgi:AcrR family transcriptional regulator
VAIKNDRILDAAAVVLVERPNATLQTIANAAGISRTTIFNRYATREDLLEALGVHALQRIGAVDATPTPG